MSVQGGVPMSNEYLAGETENAARRIKPYIRRTAFEKSLQLSQMTGACVYLKLESLQLSGAFKVRGAFNKVLKYNEVKKESDKKSKFYTASSGNHGLALTLALGSMGRKPVVFVTENCTDIKVEALMLHGADVRKFGDDCVVTEAESRKEAEKEGGVYVSPYNDADIIAGQGTIGLEMFEDCNDLDAVFVTVGGGGLISGISAYLKHKNQKMQIIGCSPINSNCMEQSVKARKQFDIVNKETLSEGSAGNIEIPSLTFPICHRNVDRWVNVTEEEISKAMFLMVDLHHQIVEGAAGCALASFLKVAQDFKGKNVGVLICGANIATAALKRVIDSHLK